MSLCADKIKFFYIADEEKIIFTDTEEVLIYKRGKNDLKKIKRFKVKGFINLFVQEDERNIIIFYKKGKMYELLIYNLDNLFKKKIIFHMFIEDIFYFSYIPLVIGFWSNSSIHFFIENNRCLKLD